MIRYEKVNSHFLIETSFGTFLVPNYGFYTLDDSAAIFILAKFLCVNVALVNEAVRESWDTETFEKNLILWKIT